MPTKLYSVVDFSKVSEEIANAARNAFKQVLKQHFNEQYFAFVLSSIDNAVHFVAASVNSFENHLRILKNNQISIDFAEEEYFRWEACEWGDYEYVGIDHFNRVNKLLSDTYEKPSNNCYEEWYEEFRNNVSDSMQQALVRLDSEGLWGDYWSNHAPSTIIDCTGNLHHFTSPIV